MSTPKSLDKKPQKDNTPIIGASVNTMSIYAGPIPSADELAKYENILPGSANRILEMAEKQSRHRQNMESEMLKANIKSEHVGQIFGFTIFGLTIIAGFILVVLGKNIEGLISLIAALGTIVGLFVYNRTDMKKELKEKDIPQNKSHK